MTRCSGVTGPMGPDVPIGSEIAAALLVALASVLIIVAKRIVSHSDQGVRLPSDQAQSDLRPVADRADAGGQQTLERLEQHDRHVAQLIQSLHDNLQRTQREKELEDRRQFERVLDKIDRIQAGRT